MATELERTPLRELELGDVVAIVGKHDSVHVSDIVNSTSGTGYEKRHWVRVDVRQRLTGTGKAWKKKDPFKIWDTDPQEFYLLERGKDRDDDFEKRDPRGPDLSVSEGDLVYSPEVPKDHGVGEIVAAGDQLVILAVKGKSEVAIDIRRDGWIPAESAGLIEGDRVFHQIQNSPNEQPPLVVMDIVDYKDERYAITQLGDDGSTPTVHMLKNLFYKARMEGE